MPTLSKFYGIIVQMYWRDHAPAHFHAYYREHEVHLGIPDLTVLHGSLPRPQMRMLLKWARAHRDELAENWKKCGTRQPLAGIDPLP